MLSPPFPLCTFTTVIYRDVIFVGQGAKIEVKIGNIMIASLLVHYHFIPHVLRLYIYNCKCTLCFASITVPVEGVLLYSFIYGPL